MEAVKATIQTNHPSGMELVSSSSRDSSLPGVVVELNVVRGGTGWLSHGDDLLDIGRK